MISGLTGVMAEEVNPEENEAGTEKNEASEAAAKVSTEQAEEGAQTLAATQALVLEALDALIHYPGANEETTVLVENLRRHLGA